MEIEELNYKKKKDEESKKKNNIFFFIGIILLFALVILGICFFGKPSSQKELDFSKGIVLTQDDENSPVNFVLVHVPSKEVFISTLHPAASLYEGVTEEKAISKCYDNLKQIFRNHGVYVETVENALARNRTKLEQIAFNSLKYEKYEDKDDKTTYNDFVSKQFSYYLSDEYKLSIIKALTDDQLLDIVFTQPTMKLKLTNSNTFCEFQSQSFNPVGNLVFCRDQQITTKKGVVIGKLKSSQRALENDIMHTVYNNLNANVIGRIPNGSYLEGGDFFVAKPDLSMCGVGLRTTVGGVNYLMEKDLLGTDRFAVVYDDEDLDQQRMHLDTYFNILSPKHVIALDFDQCGKVAGKNIHRKVYLYSKKKGVNKIKSNNQQIKTEVGEYVLTEYYDDFYAFLNKEGYQIIKVTHQEQADYMINFLNIGNNNVLAVNPNLKDKVKDTGVNVIYVPFQPVLKMFGAMHCATQVSRGKSIDDLIKLK